MYLAGTSIHNTDSSATNDMLSSLGSVIVREVGYYLSEAVFMGREIGTCCGKALVKGGQLVAYGLDKTNLISLGIRKGPKVISVPLTYLTEEIRGLKDFFLHPLTSVQKLVQYFIKKPGRLARLMSCCGVPFSPHTLQLLKQIDKLNQAEQCFQAMMKDGPCLVVGSTKALEKTKGKMVLSLLNCLFSGRDEDLIEIICQYSSQLMMLSGQRVVGKSAKAALNNISEALSYWLSPSEKTQGTKQHTTDLTRWRVKTRPKSARKKAIRIKRTACKL